MTLRRKLKSYRAYGNSQYLKKADIPEPVCWTVSDAQERSVSVPGKPPALKPVLFFNESQKGLVLNMANGDVLFDMTGTDQPEEWIGVQVELYVDPTVSYAGNPIGGVRLRPPQTANEPY
jgi:hypothetical protein